MAIVAISRNKNIEFLVECFDALFDADIHVGQGAGRHLQYVLEMKRALVWMQEKLEDRT